MRRPRRIALCYLLGMAADTGKTRLPYAVKFVIIVGELLLFLPLLFRLPDMVGVHATTNRGTLESLNVQYSIPRTDNRVSSVITYLSVISLHRLQQQQLSCTYYRTH